MELRALAPLAAVLVAASATLLAPRAALADPPAPPAPAQAQVIELDEPDPKQAPPAPPTPPPPVAPPPAPPVSPSETSETPAKAPAVPKGTLRFDMRGTQSQQIIVSVDGIILKGSAVLLPVEVTAAHQIVIAALGDVERRQEVDVEAGQTKIVAFDFTGVPEPAIETAPVQQQKPEVSAPSKRANYTVALAGAGVAVVGLTVGIGGTLAALSHKRTLDAGCSSAGHCPPSLHGELDAGKRWANVGTAGFVIAGVGAAVGGVGIVLAVEHARAQPAESARGVTVRPWIGPGSAGMNATF